jgi:hypothetical protein
MIKARLPFVIFAFGVLLNAGCSSDAKPPEDLIDRETFVILLAEVQLIEAIYNQNMIRNDQPRDRLARYYQDTFEQHQVSREAFTETYGWYYRHPKLMMELYDEVIAELSRRQTEIMQRKE